MAKDTKILIAGLGVMFILLFVLAFWLVGRAQKPAEEGLSANSQIAGLVANPEFFDLGQVPINGGIVTKEYEVKNATDKKMKLRKIATSCMCTTASIKIGEKETKYFGMEMHTDKNPVLNMEVNSGEIARVTVKFDPAAHGPEGVGPFDRIVWLYFSDPTGVKELKFSGKVVSQ